MNKLLVFWMNGMMKVQKAYKYVVGIELACSVMVSCVVSHNRMKRFVCVLFILLHIPDEVANCRLMLK